MPIVKRKKLNIMRLSQIYHSAITNIVFNIEQESANFSSEEPAGKYSGFEDYSLHRSSSVLLLWCRSSPRSEGGCFSDLQCASSWHTEFGVFPMRSISRIKVCDLFSLPLTTFSSYGTFYTIFCTPPAYYAMNIPRFAWPLAIYMYYSFLTLLRVVITPGYRHPSKLLQVWSQTLQQSKYRSDADRNHSASGGSFLQLAF